MRSRKRIPPLHQINLLRLIWIEGLASLAGKSVFDVGCAGGILSDPMACTGALVSGYRPVHPSAPRVARLQALEAGTANVNYRETSPEAPAQEQPASFDLVTCVEMLEPVPDAASEMRAISAPIKPGWWVLFPTINRNPKSLHFAIVGAEYVLQMRPQRHARMRQADPPQRAGQ